MKHRLHQCGLCTHPKPVWSSIWTQEIWFRRGRNLHNPPIGQQKSNLEHRRLFSRLVPLLVWQELTLALTWEGQPTEEEPEVQVIAVALEELLERQVHLWSKVGLSF